MIPPTSNLCTQVLRNKSIAPQSYNLNSLLAGRTPASVGVTPQIGVNSPNDSGPLSVYGSQGPAGSTSRCNIVNHRGYIKPTGAGLFYVIVNGQPDDIIHVWVGPNALSGSYRAGNSQAYGQYNQPTRSSLTYPFFVTDPTEYIPLRVYWSNGDGAGRFNMEVRNQAGQVILGPGSSASQQIIAGCSGSNSPVPAWPAWQSEIIGA